MLIHAVSKAVNKFPVFVDAGPCVRIDISSYKCFDHAGWTWWPNCSSNVTRMIFKPILSNLRYPGGINNLCYGTKSSELGANSHEALQRCGHRSMTCFSEFNPLQVNATDIIMGPPSACTVSEVHGLMGSSAHPNRTISLKQRTMFYCQSI